MRLEETAVNTFQNPQTHHCDRSTRKGSNKGCLHLQTEALSMIQIKEEQYSQYVGMLYWVALKMWPLCSSTWRIKVEWWEKGARAQPAAKWKDEHSQLFNFSSHFYLVFLFLFQPSYPIDNPNQHPSCRGTKPPCKQAGNWPSLAGQLLHVKKVFYSSVAPLSLHLHPSYYHHIPQENRRCNVLHVWSRRCKTYTINLCRKQNALLSALF